jgi:allantoate deiminase
MSYLKTLDASIIPREDILRLEEDGSLVCTVGSLQTWPGASNVIPQNVNFTLDIRSLSDSSRNNIVRIIESIMEGECAKRELMCRLKKKHEASSVTMDEILTEKLINSVKMAEYDGKKEASTNTCSNIEVVRIASGAGHDALAVSSIMPVSMLFVRSRNGISHSPDEWVDPEDIRARSITTFYFIRDWEKGPW